jgi:hypothetical protein
MTIVRIGLAETKNYADGWDAIFSKGKRKPAKAAAKKKSKQSKKKKT